MLFKFFCFFLLLALFLPACLLSPLSTPVPVPTSTSTVTITPTITSTTTPTSTQTPVPTFTSTFTETPLPTPKRVFILSVDGLRPDAILQAPMPNLIHLLDQGAYSFSAQTTYPSATLPSHTSMLTGLCPSKHGVDWNDYLPEMGYAQGVDLFDLAHAAGLQTVMYVGKQKLCQITEPDSVDILEFISDRDLVIAERLIEQFPLDFGLLFVHFPTADWMGHEYGWLSFEQLNVLRQADEALGNLLSKFDAEGLRDETMIIVSSDHGGHDMTHGSLAPEDMTIPWIAVGPGIEPRLLTKPIYTMDTAATAAWALGLPIPLDWDGVPVLEAFGLPNFNPQATERPAQSSLEVCP